MFTLAKIKDGGTYLERHLAANDYYCENESVVGKWVGEGARRLGLDQDIRSGDKSFENLRNNRVPDSTEKLTPRDSPNRVKFFDFQCSAQKSVSVMAVTMGDTRLLTPHRISLLEDDPFDFRAQFAGQARGRAQSVNELLRKIAHRRRRAVEVIF
jgi:hypothetical protein